MREVFIVSGQSNAQSDATLVCTRDDRLDPPYVPAYAQTAANEWTGAAPASIDSGYQYRYPTADNSACIYNENARGTLDGVFDDRGDLIQKFPNFNLGGTVAQSGGYGLELSFLQKHLLTYPSKPIGCLKHVLGGSSLRGNWLPNTVSIGTARAGTSNTIQLASSNFIDPTGLYIRIVAGTGAGQERISESYDSGTKTATVSVDWDTPPDNTSEYGIERMCAQVLRVMIAQEAAAYDVIDGPGNWRWAAFLWMQGESGAHAASTAVDDSQYLSDARAFFAWVRSLTRADLPVGVGVIGDNWGWETDPNPYLDAAGYPWAAIDYSINHTDGRIAGDQTTRDSYLAGAVARRATQRTLGQDDNCFGWSNDGYPIKPPYSLTSATNDLTAYHWAGPGRQTSGERAFTAFNAMTGLNPSLSVHIGGLG